MDRLNLNTNTNTNKTSNKTMNLPDGSYDQQVRRFYCQKLIIARIMKHMVDEYAHMTIEEIIAHLDKEYPDSETHIPSHGVEIGTDKGNVIRTDILFTTTPPGSKKPIPIIINLEPQNDPEPGYPLVSRGIYYTSRLISMQEQGKKIKELYKNIRKVYSIWICYNTSRNPVKHQNSIITYKTIEHIYYGHPKTAEKSAYDKSQVWIITLGNYQNAEPQSLLRLLDIAFSSDISFTDENKFAVLEEEYNITNAVFKQEVKDLNAFVLDVATDYARDQVAKRDLEWKEKVAQKDTLVQKLLAAKRYVDLENMYKDAALQQKLYAEFGLV